MKNLNVERRKVIPMLNKTKIVMLTNLGADKKEQIECLIEPISTYIKEYCNVKELNSSLELAGALMIQYIIENANKANIASESITDIGSISYRDKYPDHIMNILNVNKKTKFNIF